MSISPEVGHYHPVWLPQTMTWLFRQVTELEAYCHNTVYCERIENLDLFPVSEIYSFETEPFLTRLTDRIHKKLWSKPGLASLMKHMKMNQINVLHSHFGHIGIVGTRMANALGIPSVVSFYGMDLHQIPKRYPHLGLQYPEMFENASLILCEGNQMAQSVVNMGADKSKVIVHPLGIELDSIEYISRRWEPGIPLKILIAASFRPKKGITSAIHALSTLVDKYDVEITIVGDSGYDQASILEKDAIFSAIKSLNLEKKVRLLGYKTHPELLEIAKSHHIYLQPSQHADDGDCEGGVPVTLIELAAQGLQVVSTYHCDIPSVIEHESTGWLAPERNIDELIRVLNQAVENYDSWADMSLKARKHIEFNYNAKSQAKTLHELYSGVLNG